MMVYPRPTSDLQCSLYKVQAVLVGFEEASDQIIHGCAGRAEHEECPGFMPATRCQPEPMKLKMAFIGTRQATSAHNEADNQSTGTPRICICQIDWK